MDNFLSRPCVASDFAHDDGTKRNHCTYINENDDDDDSFILSSCQCEKRINHEDNRVDSTLAFFAATQHTLSTFCSTESDDDDDDDDDDDLSGCWNDDDISLGSFNDGYQFDCQPLGVDNDVDSAEQTPMGTVNACMAQPMVITFNNNTITENIQGNPNEQIHVGDLFTSFHNSHESMFGGGSRGSFQPHDMLVGQHAQCPTNQGLNDSMTSLSAAFEKLDYCMLRTAQSRKLVRQLTEKMALSSSTTLPGASSTATFLATSTTSAAAAASTSTVCSTILRSNSLSSLNGSGSVSSKSHRKRGPKSFHKTRRHVNKATLSNKTGVALRTLLNASFS